MSSLVTVFRFRWKILVLSLAAQLILSALFHLGVSAPKALGFLALPKVQAQTTVQK